MGELVSRLPSGSDSCGATDGIDEDRRKPQGFYSDVRVYGTIDGQSIGNWAYRQGYNHSIKQEGRPSPSGNSISAFVFTALESGECEYSLVSSSPVSEILTCHDSADDEDLTVDENMLKDLGVIKLRFHTCVYGATIPRFAYGYQDHNNDESFKIHEKRKKNISDKTRRVQSFVSPSPLVEEDDATDSSTDRTDHRPPSFQLR